LRDYCVCGGGVGVDRPVSVGGTIKSMVPDYGRLKQ